MGRFLDSPVVINLSMRRLNRNLHHVGDLWLLFFVRSGLFDRLIVVHFTLEVAEVLNLFLLLVSLRHFHGENHVGTVAFLESVLHLLD